MVNNNKKIIYSSYFSLSEIFQTYILSDLNKKQNLDNLYYDCINFLSFELNNEKDIDYFNIEIKIDTKGDKIDVKAKNIITALWFLNIFPDGNLEQINNKNKYELMNGTKTTSYKFYPKTKKLKIIE